MNLEIWMTALLRSAACCVCEDKQQEASARELCCSRDRMQSLQSFVEETPERSCRIYIVPLPLLYGRAHVPWSSQVNLNSMLMAVASPTVS